MAYRLSGLPVDHRDQGLTRPTLQRREHNDSQPIFAILPTEIILRIVLILTSPPADIYDEDKDYQPTPCLSLSQTCHQFREVVLSSPNAWTLIPLKCHLDWTRECLRRSRPVPFSLVIDEEDVRFPEAPHKAKRERAKMLALRELHRIRVLSLPAENPSICHSLTRRAPELEFLSLEFASNGVALPKNLFGATEAPLPKLKSVELTCVHIHPDAHLLRAETLTNLTIVISRLWADTDTMVSALSRLVNLELLHIEHSIVTESPALSQANGPSCISLPRLKYLLLSNDFYQNLIPFHYLQLSQSLHAVCIRNSAGTPSYELYGSMLQGFSALALPSLTQYMDDLVEAGHGALKLQLDANYVYIDVMASWPGQTAEDVSLEQFAEPDPDNEHPSLSVHVPHNGPGEMLFTTDGRQTLDALVQGRSFYASSRILSVDGMPPVLADPHAWAAARNLPSIELLDLDRASAPALAHALRTSRQQMPSFPKLRIVRFTDVLFDDNEPVIPQNGEDPSLFDLSVEEEYTGDVQPPTQATEKPLFDRLMVALERWFLSDGFERVIIRKSTITDAMVGALRAKIGEGRVDWDGVCDGAERSEEDSDGYGPGVAW
ncbi:hypothetical protein PENSPDRAFT_649123 [Peniophora sp. CONT]|nr:hypothetical protein PENSPDRAFT_649123 [Peniophora sp. CONT]